MIFRTDDKPASTPAARAARADMTARLDPRSRVTATSSNQARADMSDGKSTRSATARQARQDWIASLANPRTV